VATRVEPHRVKLTGQAANWYSAWFSNLPAGNFPPWSDFYAAMLHAYGQSYGAPAGAYQELHSLRRLPGTLGHNQQSGLRAGGGTFHAPPAQRDEQPGAREISGIHPPEPVDHRGVRSLDLPGQRRREDFRCDPPLVGHRRNQSYFAMRPSNAEPKAPSFAERKASRQCFGCTPEQRRAQGTILH
jgi:hypothetical protein